MKNNNTVKDFETVIREREAVRKYSDVKVSKTTLNKILEAGRIAPTAKNIQPQKIYVIQSENGLAKIDAASPCRFGASTVLMVCADTDMAFVNNNHCTAEIDATIVATHMMLEATNLGVDNIWIERIDREKLRESFKLPENLSIVCLLMLGYRTDDCVKSVNHNIRKPLEDTVVFC